jgi:hypothetical protein
MVIERVVPLAAERRSARRPQLWLGRVRLLDPHKSAGSASTHAYDFRFLADEKLAFGLAALADLVRTSSETPRGSGSCSRRGSRHSR